MFIITYCTENGRKIFSRLTFSNIHNFSTYNKSNTYEGFIMPQNQFQRMIFAFFTQLFFIQPLIRTIFKFLFVKNKNKEDATQIVTE